jgi:hypothetical protein
MCVRRLLLSEGASPQKPRLDRVSSQSPPNGSLATVAYLRSIESCAALCEGLDATSCATCPEAESNDVEDAERRDVRLVIALPTPGADEPARLLRPPPLNGWTPELVLGHGRITGPAAAALCTDVFPDANRIHFVHTVAEEIEWFKQRAVEPRSTAAGARDFTEKELARSA